MCRSWFSPSSVRLPSEEEFYYTRATPSDLTLQGQGDLNHQDSVKKKSAANATLHGKSGPALQHLSLTELNGQAKPTG